MKDKINIILEQKEFLIDNNLTVLDLINNYNESNLDVISVKINNEIFSLNTIIKENDDVNFLYQNDLDGNKIYKNGLKFILIAAIKELYKHQIEIFFEHSIDKGICFTLKTTGFLPNDILLKIKEKMLEIINYNYPFKKVSVYKKDAIEFFEKLDYYEKAKNIQNISNEFVTLYNLKDYYNYFYTDMPYSTKCLKYFNIMHIEDNKFVLLFPLIENGGKVPNYTHYPLNMLAFKDYKEWIHSLNIFNVCDVNALVSQGMIEEFIRTNELYLQKNILKAAEKIVSLQNKRIILVAGPSSSGKTTTSKKLSVALKTFGKNILNISLDDYYVDQINMPIEAIKNRDFESIDLLDLELLNKQIDSLLKYESVILPKYDFITGKKTFNNQPVKINEDYIIIIEGLHALNDLLLTNVSSDILYKLYISPFEPLSIDRHNHLSTLDLRLIRRIVRDSKFRGVTAEETIKSWQKVREGEERYIFPYMKNVDSVLNTSLIYEMGILKVYAEPLLYSVPVTSKAYKEAKRLIDFLKIFYPIPSEWVEKNSLLREFIGGSIFK